jgi:hypothetical protein
VPEILEFPPLLGNPPFPPSLPLSLALSLFYYSISFDTTDYFVFILRIVTQILEIDINDNWICLI